MESKDMIAEKDVAFVDSSVQEQDDQQFGEIRRGSIHDAVFGELTEDGPNYRNVGWLGTVALMMKTQIGLGVLSIPLTFNALGLIPGVICLITIAILTTWSDWVVGTFKLNHPQIYSIDDAGQLMFGLTGRIILGASFVLFWIFVAGSGMLGISIALNALSTHAACTAVFVAVAAIVAFVLGSIRTLGRISILAWIGLTGIIISILTLTIAVSLQNRPAAAPQTGPWVSDYKLFNRPTWAEATSALSSLVFAFAGTPGFFAIISEMREPRKYTRSLMICQTGVTITYTVIGVVVYYYCGSYVTSPALGSAGGTVKKVCYGFALPGLIVTTMLVTHIAAKYLFVHILRGSVHLADNSFVHWGTWLGCTFSIVVIAYIIASSIPVFGELVALVGALLGTMMSLQPMGAMWLYDNWKVPANKKTTRWRLKVAWSVMIVVVGTFLMVSGTYGSVVAIIDSYKAGGKSSAFSCADNSGAS